MFHPNINLEGLESSCEGPGFNLILQLLQDGKKLGWYPKFRELFPKHLIKGSAEIHEGYVQVFTLLSALLKYLL